MDQARRIEELIAPSLEAMGYAVVRVRVSGGQRLALQVMIERSDLEPLTLDVCAEASRTISALLDVEDPIGGSYILEVSSPGIDRPLTRLGDFERFTGFEAKIELEAPLDGRKRFRGRLLGTDDETVRLAMDMGEVALPFGAIATAKLVLTDELIAAAQTEKRE